MGPLGPLGPFGALGALGALGPLIIKGLILFVIGVNIILIRILIRILRDLPTKT